MSVKFATDPNSVRHFATFYEADKAARRGFAAGNGRVYALHLGDSGKPHRAEHLATVCRLQNGRLVTDLTFAGCNYA